MIVVNEKSDDQILAAQRYLRNFRESIQKNETNGLYLFLALDRLNRAELEWRKDGNAAKPMRREWQVMRRYVMSRIGRMAPSLLHAKSPKETEAALLLNGTNKRATLAYRDAHQTRWTLLCLTDTQSDKGRGVWNKKTLRLDGRKVDWEAVATKIGVSVGQLKKRASELGITSRKPSKKTASNPHKAQKEILSGRRLIRGSRY